MLLAIEAALKSVNSAGLVKAATRYQNNVLEFRDIDKQTRFDSFGNLYVVGAGKAAAAMADSLYSILQDRISLACITVPYGIKPADSRVSFTQASHPIPDENGIKGSRKILSAVKKAGKNDLVVVLVSGGGSALMPLPAGDLDLQDKQRITAKLLASGASIQEINAVRKHLSSIKGGQLAAAAKSKVVSLVISDVVGDDLSVISSGPTFPDNSTFSDALEVVRKYEIASDEPAVRHLKDGVAGRYPETPKPGDKIFDNVYNFLIGNNSIACRIAAASLKKSGFEVDYLGSGFVGEAKEFGQLMAAKTLSKNQALVAGGETTVKLGSKSGKGGRNQEAGLSFAINAKDDVVAAFLGTDGIDGNSDAAGALVSAVTRQAKDLDVYLENHDSYHALAKTGSLIFTGLTGTNVNDIAIICRY